MTVFFSYKFIIKIFKELDMRHKSIDDHMRKNEKFKYNQIKKQQEQSKIKEDELFKFMKKTDEIEMKRSIEIQMRQDSVERRRKIKEAEMRKTMQEKAFVHLKKEEHIVKQKSQFEIFKEEYDMKINDRITKINEKVSDRKEKTYKEMINKFDTLQIKREDNLDKYNTNEKAHEYDREKRLEAIVERMRRFEEIK